LTAAAAGGPSRYGKPANPANEQGGLSCAS
jgi:hypothetical protein